MAKAVRRWVSLLMVIVALGVAGFVASQLVARPISTDLSGLGRGKPALVLAYANFSPVGGSALERLGRVRADYDDRMLFRVADLGTPEGSAFAASHRLEDGVAVFLGPRGVRVRAAAIPATEQELRRQLDRDLARVGVPD